MSDLYNRIDRLCKERGINITILCREAKVARASLSELNAGRTKTLTLETSAKLARALNIPVDELLGTEKSVVPDAQDRKSDIEQAKIALFGGDEEVTDEMWQEALLSAEIIKARHRRMKEEND